MSLKYYSLHWCAKICSMVEKAERVKVLEFPKLKKGVYSEYDMGKSGRWEFSVESAAPEIQAAGQSAKNLLVDSESWKTEAFSFRPTSSKRKSDRTLSFVFYSPQRETDHFYRKDLVLDLAGVVDPEIKKKYPEFSACDFKGNLHRIDLKTMNIPPFSTKTDPENPTYPYVITSLVIRDFNIYLKFLQTNGGMKFFKDPAYDPRRLVVEIDLKNSVQE